jgi:malonyl-CoA/methylmalonyl-CoA synthetase
MLYFKTKALKNPDSIAVKSNDQTFSYTQLLNKAEGFAKKLLGNQQDLNEATVAFMVSPGFEYVYSQWAIWLSGGIAVPISESHPLESIKYILENTGAKTLICSKKHKKTVANFCAANAIDLWTVEELSFEDTNKTLPDIDGKRKAMILYTSGTTSLPKGVLSTHNCIEFQIKTLVEAWDWKASDHIINVLPLHHIHGIINILGCSMYVGAICEFLPNFSEEKLLGIFKKGQVNVFMAVPTIYYKLISYIEGLNSGEKSNIKSTFSKFRLMVCGSAALPVSVMEKWEKISGHRLLERYGMTEIGMAISNSYQGNRIAGYVGQALPNVKVRLVSESNEVLGKDEPGEIQIKGPNVFSEYWQNPKATKEAFTEDGWFKTGDIALYENGSYKILGRNSTDIIKSGGYKISALEIEEIIRTYKGINDCAVVGIPNEEWGEIVACALETNQQEVDLESLNQWIREKLPSYRVPRNYIIMDTLPRNNMGKVTKNNVKDLFKSKK